MKAGRMDRMITLQRATMTQNSYGEMIPAWFPLAETGAELSSGTLTVGLSYQITATQTDYFGTGRVVGDVFTATEQTALSASNKVKPVTRGAQAWAERRELRGEERYSAHQEVAKIDAKYFIHYRAGIKTTDRLIDSDSRVYDIKAVLMIGRRSGLELHVEARAE